MGFRSSPFLHFQALLESIRVIMYILRAIAISLLIVFHFIMPVRVKIQCIYGRDAERFGDGHV